MMQPTKKSCGQTCIAMICGISWFQATEAMGHMRSTSTKQVVSVLRRFGCTVEDHLTVLRKNPLPASGTYLVKLCYDKGSHWVVLHEGQIYDPAHGMNPALHSGWRYTSYLKIRR